MIHATQGNDVHELIIMTEILQDFPQTFQANA
jgi:hypothetical protein